MAPNLTPPPQLNMTKPDEEIDGPMGEETAAAVEERIATAEALVELNIVQETDPVPAVREGPQAALPSDLEAPTESELDRRYTVVLQAADPKLGDKDPVVIQWCRENLSPEAFNEKYGHRNI